VLVSHRHKFIYTKTLKTAGTSVESYFERYCLEDPGNGLQSEYRPELVSAAGIIGARSGTANGKNNTWWNHMPAVQIRDQLGAEIFNSYFKFCCIRNPYDKALSAFYWYQGLGSVEVPDGLDEPHRFEYWMLNKGPPGDRNKYAIKGKYCLDAVIRYENLAADVQTICETLHLPWEPERLKTFKAGVRPEGQSIEAMYTPKARAKIEELYDFELSFFDYTFPAETAPAD
jgi:hypothetical protein